MLCGISSVVSVLSVVSFWLQLFEGVVRQALSPSRFDLQ
jgi:hypothetical protein